MNTLSVLPGVEPVADLAADFEIIARDVSGCRGRLEAIEKRLSDVEKVNERLEEAALTTARALSEISGHWDAVSEAMRRKDESQEAPER